MSFGLDKCSRMISKRGKTIRTKGLNHQKAALQMLRTTTSTLELLRHMGTIRKLQGSQPKQNTYRQ